MLARATYLFVGLLTVATGSACLRSGISTNPENAIAASAIWLEILTNATPQIGRSWELLTIAPFPARTGHTVTAFQGRLYLIGGIDNQGVTHGDAWSSSDGRTWVLTSPSAVTPRRNHAAVGTGGQLIVVGGLNAASGSLNDVIVFDGASWNATGQVAPLGAVTHLFVSRGEIYSYAQGSINQLGGSGFNIFAGTVPLATPENRRSCMMVDPRGVHFVDSALRTVVTMANAGALFVQQAIHPTPFSSHGPCMTFADRRYLLTDPAFSDDTSTWQRVPPTRAGLGDGSPVREDSVSDTFVVFRDRIVAIVPEDGVMLVFGSLGAGSGVDGAPLTDGSR